VGEGDKHDLSRAAAIGPKRVDQLLRRPVDGSYYQYSLQTMLDRGEELTPDKALHRPTEQVEHADGQKDRECRGEPRDLEQHAGDLRRDGTYSVRQNHDPGSAYIREQIEENAEDKESHQDGDHGNHAGEGVSLKVHIQLTFLRVSF